MSSSTTIHMEMSSWYQCVRLHATMLLSGHLGTDVISRDFISITFTSDCYHLQLKHVIQLCCQVTFQIWVQVSSIHLSMSSLITLCSPIGKICQSVQLLLFFFAATSPVLQDHWQPLTQTLDALPIGGCTIAYTLTRTSIEIVVELFYNDQNQHFLKVEYISIELMDSSTFVSLSLYNSFGYNFNQNQALTPFRICTSKLTDLS